MMPDICAEHQYDLIVHELRIPETGPWRAHYVVAQMLFFQGLTALESFQSRVGKDGDQRTITLVLAEIGCPACHNRALYKLVVRTLKKGMGYAAKIVQRKGVDDDWRRWMGADWSADLPPA